MPEAAQYPIDTLVEMAAIPEEALPRFLAELPMILGEVRRMLGVMDTFNSTFVGEMEMQPLAGASWTDDDKGEGTVSVLMPDGSTVAATRKMGGDA
jgi:hypothetical protein